MNSIAIVGRKNVGKSSLFNLLTRSKGSVNINYYGYTRDSNIKIAKFHTVKCQIIDTAGIGYEKSDIDYITLKKTWKLIKSVDIIIYLSEVDTAYNYLEKNILNTLRSLKKKIIYVVNKIDTIKEDGFRRNINKSFIYISVKNKVGINILISKITSLIKHIETKISRTNKMRLSVIGRPNIGKSTLVNSLTQSNNMIICDKPGTTRDNISLYTKKDNKCYDITDTPGIKKTIKTRLDKIYIEKSIESIKLSDISIVLIDINEMLTKLDNLLLNIKKTYAYIIVFNKCDLVKKSFLAQLENRLKFTLKFDYIFISAKHGFGINRIFDRINQMKILREKKIDLNKSDFIVKDNIKIKKLMIRSNYPLIIDLYVTHNIKKHYEKYIQSLLFSYFKNDNMLVKIVKV